MSEFIRNILNTDQFKYNKNEKHYNKFEDEWQKQNIRNILFHVSGQDIGMCNIHLLFLIKIYF